MDKRYGYNWTPAAIERLKSLWAEGYSASEVGGFLGVSRNSVIGKLHRLGLTGMPRRRTRPQGSNAPKMAKRVRKPQSVAQLLKTPEQPVSKGPPAIGSFSLMDLRFGHCRWPEGDAPPYAYCGDKALEGESYCGPHHKRAHQGPQHRALRPIESYAIRRSRQAA